jgi:hypothetical protein
MERTVENDIKMDVSEIRCEDETRGTDSGAYLVACFVISDLETTKPATAMELINIDS